MRAQRAGENPMMTAPTSGRKTTAVSSPMDRLPPQDQEVRAGHGDQPERDARARSSGRARSGRGRGRRRSGGHRADAVDDPVDDVLVEPGEGIREPAADDDEQQVVDVVEPPLVGEARYRNGRRFVRASRAPGDRRPRAARSRRRTGAMPRACRRSATAMLITSRSAVDAAKANVASSARASLAARRSAAR